MKVFLRYIFVLQITLLFRSKVDAQIVFTSIDSLLNYAVGKSLTLQANDIKQLQAKQAKLAAILNIPEVSGGVSFAYTNNTRLPINLFPAEAFGGPQGSFKEVQTGVQYVSNFNQTFDIKLLNFKGWENLKLAKLNIDATASDNKMILKSLFENIANVYFNIINLQEQALSAKQNLSAADTLLMITKNKYNEGLIKQQDVNDAKANLISIQESLNQIDFITRQQYLNLKLLCDIPDSDNIALRQTVSAALMLSKPTIQLNNLSVNNSLLKTSIALSNYRQLKYSLYPSLSFFQSYTSQQFNTKGKLFDNRVNWFSSSFVGLKLNIPIPNANTIAQASNAHYNYLLSQKQLEQLKVKSAIEVQQLSVEFDKAKSQAQANMEIYELRKDSYQKNLNLYNAGLLSLDQTLNSFNAMLSANYNSVSSVVGIMMAQAKININNKIK